jgi:predicted nucleic acid-binding Zn ribbon protein
MPFYDYFCEENKMTVEVHHGMSVKLKTWGDVCKAAGIEIGKTPATTPVIRMVSGARPTVFRLKGLDKDAPTPRKLMV